eukprot:scaffold45691_cov74-Cyclotella_meneghiniana.AAC.11
MALHFASPLAAAPLGASVDGKLVSANSHASTRRRARGRDEMEEGYGEDKRVSSSADSIVIIFLCCNKSEE